MIAFSAGGRSAATCSALKPPQDLPIIPTRPLAPGPARDPGDHVAAVVELLLEILVGEVALGIARAAKVDANRRIALAGEPSMHRLVAACACRRACDRG